MNCGTMASKKRVTKRPPTDTLRTQAILPHVGAETLQVPEMAKGPALSLSGGKECPNLHGSPPVESAPSTAHDSTLCSW